MVDMNTFQNNIHQTVRDYVNAVYDPDFAQSFDLKISLTQQEWQRTTRFEMDVYRKNMNPSEQYVRTHYQVPTDQFEEMVLGGEDWLHYICQPLLRNAESGIFAYWFAEQLVPDQGKFFMEKILPLIHYIQYVKQPKKLYDDMYIESPERAAMPYRRDDKEALAVFTFNDGRKWREKFIYIAHDPESFLANLTLFME